jgi:hypothetical protein
MNLLIAGVLFPALLCLGAHAQVSGGTVSGIVTSAGQAALPNARVTLGNVATGVARVVTTDAVGLYTSPNLEPGTYEITIEAPGFFTQVRTEIAVAVGALLTVNVEMQAGDPKQVNRGRFPQFPKTRRPRP